MKKYVEKILSFIVAHKKASAITGIVLAALLVLLLIFFIFFKPKWDYSHKIVATVNGKKYTQSQIDEVGAWWLSGDYEVIEEGNTPVEK